MYTFYNPYFGYNPKMNPAVSPQPQPQPVYNPIPGLQGKSVDSLEVVKAMDIPLDGSISYFPLVDGSAIVTKQLQQDGTSKTVVFKPTDTGLGENNVKYLTSEEFEKNLQKFDKSQEIQELKNELKSLKQRMRFLIEEEKGE